MESGRADVERRLAEALAELQGHRSALRQLKERLRDEMRATEDLRGEASFYRGRAASALSARDEEAAQEAEAAQGVAQLPVLQARRAFNFVQFGVAQQEPEESPLLGGDYAAALAELDEVRERLSSSQDVDEGFERLDATTQALMKVERTLRKKRKAERRGR